MATTCERLPDSSTGEKFCEGARTCVQTRWHYSNASRGLPTHKTNAVCPPVFRTQHTFRSTKKAHWFMLSSQQLCENVAVNFRREFSQKFVVGILLKLIVMEQKGFQLHRGHYSYRAWKALYILDLLYNHGRIKLLNPNDPKPQHRGL